MLRVLAADLPDIGPAGDIAAVLGAVGAFIGVLVKQLITVNRETWRLAEERENEKSAAVATEKARADERILAAEHNAALLVDAAERAAAQRVRDVESRLEDMIAERDHYRDEAARRRHPPT